MVICVCSFPDANVLFLESPTGVGFSYSNDPNENQFGGDNRTGEYAHAVALDCFVIKHMRCYAWGLIFGVLKGLGLSSFLYLWAWFVYILEMVVNLSFDFCVIPFRS